MTAMRPMADRFFPPLTFSEGRGVAAEVDTYLQNSTRLPTAGGIKARVSTPPFHVLGLRSRGRRVVHVLTPLVSAAIRPPTEHPKPQGRRS